MVRVFNKMVKYPLIWTPKSKREFTSKEKASIKSCKVVQSEITGNLGIEFCMHAKYKGKHVRNTILIWFPDEDKFQVNQKVNINDLAVLTATNNCGTKVFRITLK